MWNKTHHIIRKEEYREVEEEKRERRKKEGRREKGNFKNNQEGT